MISKYFKLDEVTFVMSPEIMALDRKPIIMGKSDLPELEMTEIWRESTYVGGWGVVVYMELKDQIEDLFNNLHHFSRDMTNDFSIDSKGVYFSLSLETIIDEGFKDLVLLHNKTNKTQIPSDINQYEILPMVDQGDTTLRIRFTLKEEKNDQ